MTSNFTLQIGVKILLQNSQGKYLLVHRNLKKYPESAGRGSWDIVGGRIKAGVTLMENLRREVREETGLEISGEPKLIAAQDILHVPGRHVIRLTYAGQAKGEVRLDGEENDAHAWHTFDELQKLEDVDVYFKDLLEQGSALYN